MSQVDLHIHTDASDGADSLDILISKVISSDISVFAISDHDTIENAVKAEQLVPASIKYIKGIEFSCISPVGKCHILGYNYDPLNAELLTAIDEGRRLRENKLNSRLDFLKTNFDISFSSKETDWLFSLNSPGKPHISKLLVERGLAGSYNEAISKYLNACKSSADKISAETALNSIISAGGIAIWAHPLGGEGEKRIALDKFVTQLRLLMDYGIRGLECYYSRYNKADITFLLEYANANGLYVSGGSDYHGSVKPDIGIGQLNDANDVVYKDEISILNVI